MSHVYVCVLLLVCVFKLWTMNHEFMNWHVICRPSFPILPSVAGVQRTKRGIAECETRSAAKSSFSCQESELATTFEFVAADSCSSAHSGTNTLAQQSPQEKAKPAFCWGAWVKTHAAYVIWVNTSAHTHDSAYMFKHYINYKLQVSSICVSMCTYVPNGSQLSLHMPTSLVIP